MTLEPFNQWCEAAPRRSNRLPMLAPHVNAAAPSCPGHGAKAAHYRLSSPDEFGRFVEAEIKRWAKVVKDNNIVVKD